MENCLTYSISTPNLLVIKQRTRIMNKLFTTLTILVLLSAPAFAQLTATANANGNQLAQTLAGNGVVVSNVTINCPTGSAGTFHNVTTNLGMTDGIVLTSGQVSMVGGPNNSGSQGQDNLSAGIPALNTLATATTYDGCTLEFDMNVLSDSVEFRYVYGSEEYPEWVNNGYNDAFAFFISGPGITGQQNLAVVPGTTTPITIDNVNASSYSQYYVSNGDGYTSPFNTSANYIQYDGFTTVLTAKKKGLQPCQTYHLKLMIADGGDGIYDSGVFLEANSLTSNYVTIDTAETDAPNIQNAMEGCVRGVIRFRMDHASTSNTTVQYTIGGTATNGVDYANIPNTVVIPAGDTVASIFINPISDNLAEGTETVVVSLYTACSNIPYDSAVLLIIDSFGVNAGVDQNICAGDQAQLNATGVGVFSWSPANSLSSTNSISTIATPSVTTTYRVVADMGICQSEDFVTVNVIAPPFSVNAGPDASSCTTPNMPLNAVVTGSQVNGSPFVYTWSPANGLSATNVANPTASPSTSTTYVVQVASGNCKVTDTISVTLGSLNLSAVSTNETCYGYNNGTASVTANGTSPYSYVWSNTATTQSVTGLAGGNYNVVVTDASGCSASASVTVASTAPIFFSNPVINNIKCFGGNDGSIDITAAGGAGSITYAWNTGSNGTTASALSGNTPYVVSATDANGCVADTTIVLLQPAPVVVTLASTNVTCNPGGAGTSITPNAGHDGTAFATANGGTGAYTYVWNTADVTPAISGLTAGTYSVVVTDANNCSASAAATLSEPQPMSVTASSLAPLCAGAANGTINANCTGGTASYMYSVSFNGSVIQSNNAGAFGNLLAGDYVINVSDAKNCVKVANINLPEPPADVFEITTAPVSCGGASYSDGKIVITPVSILNQPYLYALDNGGNQQLNEFYNVSGGAHQLHIINNNGCTTDTTVMVAQPAEAVLEIIPGDTTIELGGSIQLNTSLSSFNPDSALSYSWSPNQGLTCTDCANPVVNSFEKTNEYSLTVTYNGHCQIVAKATVNVAGAPQPFVPNAFTPNGDGNNDVFMVFGEGISKINLQVFNRWGEKVYESNNQFDGWDGTYKGLLQNTNVFVYQVTATYLNGKTFDSKGTVTLVR